MALHEGEYVDLSIPQSIMVTKTTKSVKDFERRKVKIDQDERSATISWSIADYDEEFPPEVLDTERNMKESFPEVTTTRPFFVLDGSGRRAALLSLLPH